MSQTDDNTEPMEEADTTEPTSATTKEETVPDKDKEKDQESIPKSSEKPPSQAGTRMEDTD